MLETQVTVVGNVVTDPRLSFTKDGHAFTTFRLASTPRRFDRGSSEWRDGDTLYVSVTSWRGLAENTATCLKKGQGVIVVGRLSVRPYENRDGEKRLSVEIDAAAIGPDLSRAVAFVKRAERSLAAVPDQAAAAEVDTSSAAEAVATTEGPVDWGWSAPIPEVSDATVKGVEDHEGVEDQEPDLVGATSGAKGRSSVA